MKTTKEYIEEIVDLVMINGGEVLFKMSNPFEYKTTSSLGIGLGFYSKTTKRIASIYLKDPNDPTLYCTYSAGYSLRYKQLLLLPKTKDYKRLVEHIKNKENISYEFVTNNKIFRD